jgi:hypothetical protein
MLEPDRHLCPQRFTSSFVQTSKANRLFSFISAELYHSIGAIHISFLIVQTVSARLQHFLFSIAALYNLDLR